MSEKSYKFKDLEGLQKKFDGIRYRVDDHGNVDVPDAQFDLWVRVAEGDTVKEYGDGVTVEKGDGDRLAKAYRAGGPDASGLSNLNSEK